jgi:hypothetical protein
VQQPDPWWIDQAADLPVDGTQENELLKIFRYKDGFLVLWNAPLSGKDLGRWVNTPEQLKTMLRGHWNVGKVVQWDTILK